MAGKKRKKLTPEQRKKLRAVLIEIQQDLREIRETLQRAAAGSR